MNLSFTSLGVAMAIASSLGFSTPARADDDPDHHGARFEVTVTNLTRGQQFTPVLAASHKKAVKLFVLGQPASAELAALAEGGDTAPLTAALSAMPGTGQVVSGNSLTNPGASVTLIVEGRRGFGHFSLAAMLIPTNDGFLAIDGVPFPRGRETLTMVARAYDSGTERNDELCVSIPGPNFAECGGSGGGGAPDGGEEGFVHVHAGMHGIGDFSAAARDWRNPVALITVRRLR